MTDNTIDLIQSIVMVIIAGLTIYLALRKAPAERINLNGGASESYAKAAQIAGEEMRRYAVEVKTLEDRIDLIEKKHYRITIEFALSDPPVVGVVKVEPILKKPL